MGSGRLFSRQKDIPVFIEGVLLNPKEECCQGIWCDGKGEHGIWIGSSSQVSQYLYEFLHHPSCFCFIFLYWLSSASQGQAKVFTLLEGLDSMPEDAEVFVVLEGSTLAHVTRAHNDVMLYFIVPGMCVSLWTHFCLCLHVLVCFV